MADKMRTLIPVLMVIAATASASTELVEAVRKGDLVTVQATFATQPHDQKKNLCRWAMREKQTPVLAYMFTNDFPRWGADVSELFTDESATPDVAQVFAEKCPSFMSKFGFFALNGAVLAGNTNTVMRLIELGLDPSDPRGTEALLKATGMSNVGMVKTLMDHGADPYMKDKYQYMSAVQLASKYKLIRMVRLLDTKNEYSEFLRKFETEWAAPSGSPFVGSWAYRKEGFGSFSVVLREDGTGVFAADVGSMGVLWKSQGKALRLFGIGERGEVIAEPVKEFRMEDDSDQSVLVSTEKTIVLNRVKDQPTMRGFQGAAARLETLC